MWHGQVRPDPGRSGGRDVAAAAATFLLALQAMLLALAVSGALVPGWRAVAVESGSMRPVIQTGDVVLVEEGAQPRVDDVVLIARGDQPPLLHRVVDWTDDGRAITQGDGNAEPDSTPVALEEMIGVGRAVVPSIGLPHAWIEQGRFGPLSLLAAANAALVATTIAGMRRQRAGQGSVGAAMPLSPASLAMLREMADPETVRHA